MDEAEWGRVQLAFEFVRDLTTQLITLATGVVAVTVAAAERGMLQTTSKRTGAAIRFGWALCLLSILLGMFGIMALTGELTRDGAGASTVQVPENARMFGRFQVVAFGAGIFSLVVFAWRILRQPPPAVAHAHHNPAPPVAPENEGTARRRRRRRAKKS